MSWGELLRTWTRLGPSRPIDEVDRDIGDELRFHVESLAEENRAAGMSEGDAWSAARASFGSLNAYARACRRINVGDRIMLQRFSAVLIVAMVLLGGYLVVEVRALRRQHDAALQSASRTESSSRVCGDVTGRVADTGGVPLAGTQLLVVVKTWPNGAYRQRAYATRSDAEGRFRLPGLLPVDDQHAVHIAAFCDGYAFQSHYQLTRRGAEERVAPITFRLQKAPAITLQFNGSDGRPLAGARVAPFRRSPPTGEKHLVYFQACQPVQVVCDEQGRTDVDWFRVGDSAELYVQPLDGDWERHTAEISHEREVVIVVTHASSTGG